jgi:hypothetical protein
MVWSGVGAQVASLRCPTFRPRPQQCKPKYQSRFENVHPSRKCLRNLTSRGITDLVLSSATSLAGFEVSTHGRFSGVHRGEKDNSFFYIHPSKEGHLGSSGVTCLRATGRRHAPARAITERRVRYTPLANFIARIVSDILRDDGEQEWREFGIEAALAGPAPACSCRHLEFIRPH